MTEQTAPTDTNGYTAEELAAMQDEGQGDDARKGKGSKRRKRQEVNSVELGAFPLVAGDAGAMDAAVAAYIRQLMELAQRGSDLSSDAEVHFPELFRSLHQQKVAAKGGVPLLAEGKSSSPSTTAQMEAAFREFQQLMTGSAAGLPPLPLKSAAIADTTGEDGER